MNEPSSVEPGTTGGQESPRKQSYGEWKIPLARRLLVSMILHGALGTIFVAYFLFIYWSVWGLIPGLWLIVLGFGSTFLYLWSRDRTEGTLKIDEESISFTTFAGVMRTIKWEYVRGVVFILEQKDVKHREVTVLAHTRYTWLTVRGDQFPDFENITNILDKICVEKQIKRVPPIDTED